MTDNEIWYRYDDVHYAPPIDEFERPIGEGKIKLELREYKVLSYTKKGVWVVWQLGSFTGSGAERALELVEPAIQIGGALWKHTMRIRHNEF